MEWTRRYNDNNDEYDEDDNNDNNDKTVITRRIIITISKERWFSDGSSYGGEYRIIWERR